MTEPTDDPDLEHLLDFLKMQRGVDFTGYKRPSLSRRILKRMNEVDVGDYRHYEDVLETDPPEQSKLVNTILISVTGFFRDREAWDHLAEVIVPAIIDAKPGDEPIRVWSAGCASGEEAYTLAMIFADALGIDQFKARVKIFATDTDEASLTRGRAAPYPEKQLEPVSSDKRERYFDAVGGGFRFRNDCRRSVIFGRHDITNDAPISRLDLLIDPIVEAANSPVPPSTLNELASAATPVAQLVVAVDGDLVGANTKARALFGINRDDLRRPFADLEVSYRPVELRSRIEQSYAEAQPVTIRDVSRPLADGNPQFLEVTIAPLKDPAGVDLGVAITFTDVTELGRTKVDLQRSADELGAAYDDLAAVNVRLETSNEELQSANEELETMNEELQSANEELETMNEELILQSVEIDRAERFLSATLNSLRTGVAVLTNTLDIVVWNRAAYDLFGLRADEVQGRSFLALDIALPVGKLAPQLHDLANDPRHDPIDADFDVIDRLGRPLRCRVIVDRLAESDDTLADNPEPGMSHLVVLMQPESSNST